MAAEVRSGGRASEPGRPAGRYQPIANLEISWNHNGYPNYRNQLYLLQAEEMTHAGQTSRYFLLFSYHNVASVPEDDIHIRSAAIPNLAAQMEINVSAMTHIGRQLAMIGDECNRTYSRKLEDSLFCIAKGLVASVFQTCIWSNFKGAAMKTFGSFFNNGWRKIIDSGCWILWVPLNYVYRRWVPATVFAFLMWCLVIYDLQD